MPKVSVYLPEDLYRRARERNISLSAVTQEALERVLRRADVDGWLDRERSRPRRSEVAVDVGALMDEVREEFGT